MDALVAFASPDLTPEKLASLQWLITQWARWFEAYSGPNLGFPSSVPYVSLMKHAVTSESDCETDDRLDVWRMRSCDSCIRSLPPVFENAIYARYLRGVQYSGFADEAERRLCVLLEHRGVVL